jgi:hypothetical protein
MRIAGDLECLRLDLARAYLERILAKALSVPLAPTCHEANSFRSVEIDLLQRQPMSSHLTK